MAIYLYSGCKCGDKEHMHSVHTKLEVCPDCGDPVRRLISGAPAHKLLGGGWAQDGYETVSHPRFGPTREGQGK